MRKFFSRFSKTVLLTIMSVVLLPVSVVMLVYTPWFQDGLRQVIVAKMNANPGTDFELESLRLHFPLDVELCGLQWLQNGDTMVVAREVQANVSVMPLLRGNVDVRRAVLNDAVYKMGTRDSATMVGIRTRHAVLEPATVQLSPLAIDVRHGYLADSRVDVWINPNPPQSPADTTSKSTQPVIRVDDLEIERLTYTMSLMPTIDSLGVTIDEGLLRRAAIDLNRQIVGVDSLTGSGLHAKLIMPDPAEAAATVVAPPSTTPSEPWTVQVHTIEFDKSSALYTTRYVKPAPGFDPAYISVDDLYFSVNEFYNRATNVVVPIELSGTERCGLTLDAALKLSISETEMLFDGVRLSTPTGTNLAGSGLLGVGDMTTDPSVPVGLNIAGNLATADLATCFPDLGPMLKALPQIRNIDLKTDISGKIGELFIKTLGVKLNSQVGVTLSGRLSNVMNPDKLAGHLAINGSIAEITGLKRLLYPTVALSIPPTDIDGDVTFGDGSYSGNLQAVTKGGRISLDGYFKGKGPQYDIDMQADNFPINAFISDLGVGSVSGHIQANGVGIDPFKASTNIAADAQIAAITYRGVTYRDIALSALLSDGNADLDLDSHNPSLDLMLKANGNLAGDRYVWTANTDIRDLNLLTLGLSETPADIAMVADIDADVSSDLRDINAKLRVESVSYATAENTIAGDGIDVRVLANDSVTNLSAGSRDLFVHFSAPLGVDSLMTAVGRVIPLIDKQIAAHDIDYVTLQRTIPSFRLDVQAGSDNLVTQMLADMNMGFNDLSLNASNDSTLAVDARVLGFNSGTTRIDTISVDLHQRADTLIYNASIGNRRGTLDPWARVDLNGYVAAEKITLNARQRDIDGKTGYELGGLITVSEDPDDHCTTATLHFEPYDPIIAYQKWTVNDDNFLAWDFTHRTLDANLRMHGAGSSLALYTEIAEKSDSIVHAADRDLVVQLGDIRLQDWLAMNPFSPAIKGNLSADMRINYKNDVLSGLGNAQLVDMYYGKQRVGDFKADLSVLTERSGLIRADADLWVNGQKSIMLHGALNDSTRTEPLNLDLTMLKFPLATANAFMPGIARLSGTLNGSMNVSGTQDNPRLDGWLAFDSTAVKVNMLGTEFKFDDVHIPVVNNLVTFNDFDILGCNDKPLTINGTADITSLSMPKLDLTAKSDGIQVVNSQRASKGADVYGKAYVGLNAKITGNLRILNVDATAHLQAPTNVTYVMPNAENVITSQATSDMVKFVNFTDSLAVAEADTLQAPSGTMMNINALLQIDQGTVVSVDLNADGTNKVQLKTQGALDYTATPIDPTGRLTGRLNITGGFARYTPPFMSQKLFDFEEGSYVAFNGPIANPLLNIQAVDHVRANVSQEGQNSRLIYFDVKLGVTGSLENMNVKFDLATDDDATVANELASMSESQRASAAMNLLVTNMYSAGSTQATASLGGNALYSFLTSTLNTWMANNIRGVDVSFGINQYDQTYAGSTSQATSYSYQVSKSLFDDRFKIVVGGNYTTGGEVEESLSESLINDVSLEYLLTKNGNMLVRIFRHTGYESILEGEITQTGVGFVYRRKINKLSSLFRRPRKKSTSAPSLPNQGAVINTDEKQK